MWSWCTNTIWYIFLYALFIHVHHGRKCIICNNIACDAATCDNPNPNLYCDTPVPQCVCRNPRKVLDKQNNRCVNPSRCPGECGEGQEIQQRMC